MISTMCHPLVGASGPDSNSISHAAGKWRGGKGSSREASRVGDVVARATAVQTVHAVDVGPPRANAGGVCKHADVKAKAGWMVEGGGKEEVTVLAFAGCDGAQSPRLPREEVPARSPLGVLGHCPCKTDCCPRHPASRHGTRDAYVLERRFRISRTTLPCL